MEHGVPHRWLTRDVQGDESISQIWPLGCIKPGGRESVYVIHFLHQPPTGMQQAGKDWKNHLRIFPIQYERVILGCIFFIYSHALCLCPSLSDIFGKQCWCFLVFSCVCAEVGVGRWVARKLVIKIKIQPQFQTLLYHRADCISGKLSETTVSVFIISPQETHLCVSLFVC